MHCVGRSALALASLQCRDRFRDARGASFRSLRLLYPPQEILAIEGRQRLEELAGLWLALKCGVEICLQRTDLRSFRRERNRRLRTRRDARVATPGGPELQEPVAGARDEFA